MHNPIVQVTTKDKIDLYGILLEPKSKAKKDSIIINIHGTADNFYDNEFVWEIAKAAESLNVALLSTNNRGSYTLEFYEYKDAHRNTGAAVEIFEDSVLDIDAWIKYALSLGYKHIILQGHSLGTEKVVYYMNKGKYRKSVTSVILLGFSDSFGTHSRYLKVIKDNLMKEAKTLIKAGKKYQFLIQQWKSHAGVLPQSAESYENFFSADSELSRAFPLRNGTDLTMYRKISVPILGVIGDQREYTIIPTTEAIELLKKENRRSEIHILSNCDHSFSDKEKILASTVKMFLKKTL